MTAERDGLIAEAKGAGASGETWKAAAADKLKDAGAESQEIAGKTSGTFSTVGAGLIGSGGGPLDEIKENTKRTAKYAKIQADNSSAAA